MSAMQELAPLFHLILCFRCVFLHQIFQLSAIKHLGRHLVCCCLV